MDFDHWTCPECGFQVEGQRVVDPGFIPEVLAHKADCKVKKLEAQISDLRQTAYLEREKAYKARQKAGILE